MTMFFDFPNIPTLAVNPWEQQFSRHEELMYTKHARKLMHKVAYKRKQQARKRTGRNRK